MHQIGCLSNELSPGQRICCSFRRAEHLFPSYTGRGWGRGGRGFLLAVYERRQIRNKLFLTCHHYFPNMLSSFLFISWVAGGKGGPK